MLSKTELDEIDAAALKRAKDKMADGGIVPTEGEMLFLEWGIALGSSETLKATRAERDRAYLLDH